MHSKGPLLEDKIAIITGASRGIGAEIAKSFGKSGANVAICFNKQKEQAKKVRAEILKHSVCEVFQCDISNVNSIKKTVKDIIKKFKRIDILVNNAGVLKQTDFVRITEKEYDWIMNTNLKGAFFLSQAAIPYLIKSKGTIINIASVGGQRGGPKAPHYSASKAGVISLTRSLSNLYAPSGIRVNAISPGQIETEMSKKIFQSKAYGENVLPNIPLGRVGTTQDVANAALFLASDLASYITGQVINVNGGEYLG